MEDEQVQEAPQEQTENVEPSQDEEVARERGWKPREEWKGEVPDNFMDDPAQYNAVFENNNPKLKQEVEQLRAELQEVYAFKGQFEERMKREKEAEMKALREELRQTAHTGDVRKFDQLMERQDQLQAEAAPTNGEPPEFAAWKVSNSWYIPGSADFDPERAAMADRVGEHIIARDPSLAGSSRFFETLDAELASRSQSAPSRTPVEGARRVAKAGSPRKISGWNDLPAEKQKDPTVQRIVAKMYNGDKDKYAIDWAQQQGQ